MKTARDAGFVLIIALIMLALITLVATVSANIVMSNVRVVQNIEARAALKNVALSALQEAIMTDGFLIGEKAFVVGCEGSNYTRCFDLTGDGFADDVNVSLSQPECLKASPVQNRELNVFDDEDEASCYSLKDSGETVSATFSDCADATWGVTVTAEDPVTGALVVVRQGLTTRTAKNLIATACDLNSGATDGE